LTKKGKFVVLVNEALTPEPLRFGPQNSFLGARHRRARVHSAATTFSGCQSIGT